MDSVERQAAPPRRNLHEKIAHDIGVRIVRGDYPPGTTLPTEAALTLHYAASRTAVREAFRILSAKGMTRSRQKVGTRVRPRADWNMLDPDILSWLSDAAPDMGLLDALFDVRRIVEPQAAALAALRRTPEQIAAIGRAAQTMAGASGVRLVESDLAFHEAILEATNNPILRSLGALVESAMKLSFSLSWRMNALADAALADRAALARGRQERALARHHAVFEAIRDQDPRLAEETMQAILSEAYESVAELLEPRAAE